MEWDSESVQSEDVFKQPGNPEGERKVAPSTPQNQAGGRLHEFASKTVRIPFKPTRKKHLRTMSIAAVWPIGLIKLDTESFLLITPKLLCLCRRAFLFS